MGKIFKIEMSYMLPALVVVLATIVAGSSVHTLDTDDVIDLSNDAHSHLEGTVAHHKLGEEGSSGENVTVSGMVVNVSATQKEWATGGLGPQIVGGETGSYLFDSSPVAQRGELLFSEQQSGTPTPAPVTRQLGEAQQLRMRNATNATAPNTNIVDEANAGLFDLVPLFQGVQADRARGRSIVGRCIVNVNKTVNYNMCAPGMGNGTGCSKYAISPMSDAMIQLWKNAQSMFCKHTTNCEASLCYKYPGPVGPDGMPAAPVESFTNQPLWIEHNMTVVNNASVPGNQTMVQQHLNFDMQLEKMVFCEYLSPPKLTDTSMMMTRSCLTSRRCAMKKMQRGFCADGTSTNEPPTDVPCPLDVQYLMKLKKQELALTSILCSQA